MTECTNVSYHSIWETVPNTQHFGFWHCERWHCKKKTWRKVQVIGKVFGEKVFGHSEIIW